MAVAGVSGDEDPSLLVPAGDLDPEIPETDVIELAGK
jgi:hypothetical protein